MSIHIPQIQDLLPIEVIKKDGKLWSNDVFFFDTYREGNIEHYERLFIKDKTGNEEPFTGLLYCLFPDGSLQGYSQYISGYIEGEHVTIFKNGRLSRYDHVTKEVYGSYIIEWTEKGVIKETLENYRKDNPRYRRIKKYDENGRLVHQEIICEIEFTYEFDSPDTSYVVTWHDNGEFRLIRKKVPDRETFYSEMEFDEDGYPVRFSVNPRYSPECFSPDLKRWCQFFTVDIFGEEYRIEDGIMEKKIENEWYKYSGCICFKHKDGCVESINEYKNGVLYAGQHYYYHNGNIKEFCCVYEGKEYYQHLYWYESGTLEKAVLYSYDKKKKHIICFADDGNVTSESEHNV